MSDHHSIDIDRHVRNYIIVVAALLVLTVVTVAIYYIHLSTAAAITLALFVATVKGSLVAAVFMHLISEKKLIYTVLILTVAFFFALLLLPVLTSMSDYVMKAS